MTFVGKLLVVVQVVLSICFMAFAGAVFTVQTNWKVAHKEIVEQTELDKVAYSDLDTEFNNFKTAINIQLKNETDRANAAENDARMLTQELATKTTELDTTKTELFTQRELAIIAGEEAAERRKEAVAQRVVNENLHTSLNDVITKMRSLENVIFNESIKSKGLIAKHQKLLAEVTNLKSQARANNLDPSPAAVASTQAPPPLVVGLILDTKKGNRKGSEFVEISLGSDDGLLKGHMMSVFRSGAQAGQRAKYLGEIKIVHITPDRAVGTVVDRAKNGTIERGDNVTTRL